MGSDVVFTFTVSEVERAGERVYHRGPVGRVWRGDVGASAEVVGHISGAMCAKSFELGHSYLVYARRSAGWGIVSGHCQRGHPLGNGSGDLEQLPSPIRSFAVDGSIIVDWTTGSLEPILDALSRPPGSKERLRALLALEVRRAPSHLRSLFEAIRDEGVPSELAILEAVELAE